MFHVFYGGKIIKKTIENWRFRFNKEYRMISSEIQEKDVCTHLDKATKELRKKKWHKINKNNNMDDKKSRQAKKN